VPIYNESVVLSVAAGDAYGSTIRRTFRPQAGSGGTNTTVDGVASRGSVDETFSVISSSAGNSATATDTVLVTRINSSATTNQFSTLRRIAITFDTSSIGSSAEVKAATLRMYVQTASNTGLGDTTVDVVGVTLTNANGVTTGDYAVSRWGTTVFAQMSLSTITTTGDKDFSLNSSGLSHINKTGITQLGLRLGWDTGGSFTGTWAASTSSGCAWRSADNAGGAATAPRLIVEFEPQPIMESVTLSAAADVTSSSALTAVGGTTLSASATSTEGSALTAVGNVTLSSASSIQPSSLLNAVASATLTATATTSDTSQMIATSGITAAAAASFTASSGAVADSISLGAAASISVSSQLTAVGSSNLSASAAVTPSASVTAAPSVALSASATSSMQAALTAGGAVTLGTTADALSSATVAMSATATLTAPATLGVSDTGLLALCETSLLSLDPRRTLLLALRETSLLSLDPRRTLTVLSVTRGVLPLDPNRNVRKCE